MPHPDFAEENERLQNILGYLRVYYNMIIGQKKDIDASVSYSLEHYNDDNAEQFNELIINLNRQEFLYQKVSDVTRALQKPYFARVDFAEAGKPGVKRLYIGKMTFFDEKGTEMLIIDWRAPVSTLYYEGRIGEASYDCPEGQVSGEISLKRQFFIENAVMENIMDIDITTNDAFLQAALGASKDNRLRDIVTSIQAEQNRIIRADMFRPLIVQGAAGGGKTTIALHRVAYLLYAYEKYVKPKNIMIIAPSKFFLSYISGVLPELGVENVVQTTYEDFALSIIGHKLRVRPAVQSLSAMIEGAGPEAAGAAVKNAAAKSAAAGGAAEKTGAGMPADWLVSARVKSSLAFYELFERYYKWIEKSALPKKPFEIEGFVIIPLDAIAKMLFRDYAYLPLAVRLREIRKSLSNTLKREKKQIILDVNAEYEEIHKAIVSRSPDGNERRRDINALLDERDGLLTRFTNKCKTAVSSYLKQFKIQDSLVYYAGLFANGKLFRYLAKGLLTDAECAVLSAHTLKTIRSGRIDSEDLAPLMFLQYKIHELEINFNIKHIVIDEAQDFSMFQFSALRLLLGTGSFSILGDLHQGIYAYKGVARWEDLISPAGADRRRLFERPQMMTIEQSYRTTVEIMDMANVVIKKLALPGIPLAKPVIRHGDQVEIRIKDGIGAIAADIARKIGEFTASGHRSIAIICKTGAEAAAFKKLLPDGVQMVTGNESDYEQGIKLIPSYHVKGLEFDAVCIANASKEQYNSELDIKLLYIAMTRALHALVIYSAGPLSDFLSEADDSELSA